MKVAMQASEQRDQRRLKWTIRLVSLVVVLVIWQWWGSRPGMFAIAPPSKVVPQLAEVLGSGELLSAAVGTFIELTLGYLLAVLVGVGIGALLGLSTWAYHTLEPLVTALYAAPMIALLPIIGIYLGFDLSARIFVVFSWSVFVVTVNTMTGINAVPTQLVDMARSYNASRRQIVRAIILPAALPNILTGLRLALGQAIRGAITAEFLLSMSNLGKFIFNASSTFNMPRMFAGIIFVTVLGALLLALAERVERRILNHDFHQSV